MVLPQITYTPGRTVYGVLVSATTGLAWNGTAMAANTLAAEVAGATYLANATGTRFYTFTFPPALPPDLYNLAYFDQAGQNPSPGTDAEIGSEPQPVYWPGTPAGPASPVLPTVNLTFSLGQYNATAGAILPANPAVGPDGTLATAVAVAAPGVVRADTGSNVVSANLSGGLVAIGTYLRPAGTGQFWLPLSPLQAGLTYNLTVAYTSAGSTVSETATVQVATADGAPTTAVGRIITQQSLLTFLTRSSLSALAKGDGPSGTIDVPLLQQAINTAEGRTYGGLLQLRARLGSNPVTPFFAFPLTVGGVPLIQATTSVAFQVLQQVAFRFAVRALNAPRSLQSVAALASSEDPADVSRGMSMVAAAFDKAATAELRKIVRWAQGYVDDATYVDLDLSPGARIGSPYQEVTVHLPAAGRHLVGSGLGASCGGRLWDWRDDFGWGWW